MADPFAPVTFRPIGVIRTPFTTTDGMPIQAATATGVRGTIELDPLPARQSTAPMREEIVQVRGEGRRRDLRVDLRRLAHAPPVLRDQPHSRCGHDSA